MELTKQKRKMIQIEPNEKNRSWALIELSLDYGYFGSYPPACIKCYSGGILIFKLAGRSNISRHDAQLYDREHSINEKSLLKLDKLVEEIKKIKKLEGHILMDGPSFACQVHLADGTITGFHYVSMQLTSEFAEIEKSLREVLREDFFLKKHEDKLSRLSRSIFPD